MRALIVPAGVLAALLLGAGTAAAANGKALYAQQCARCHGADGKAETPVAKAMGVRPFVGAKGEQVVAHVREAANHEAISGKLTNEELAAIAQVVAGF